MTIFLWSLLVLLLVVTALPFTKIAHGIVQGLAFPRAQFLALALGCALAFWLLKPGSWQVALTLLGVVAVIQAGFIAKFTPFWSRQSIRADDALAGDTARQISVLAVNVKMSNRDYGRLIQLIYDRDPDVVMAIEIDGPWIKALKNGLSDHFEHWIDVPQDNGYGMCVMSRLPMSDTQVRDLVTEGVPSIRTRVKLRSGDDVRLYAIHPEPPVVNHDTIGRDSEIALIGLEAAEDELPVIVSGDLNDVAWSTTTRRFQRLSRLLDPRVGRGFYNTFSAMVPLMRWPLDHLFHSPRFRLIEMARERKIGSDHFPMWFTLALADAPKINNDPGHPEPGEVQETRQMIDEEQRRDREAIGSDWESDAEASAEMSQRETSDK